MLDWFAGRPGVATSDGCANDGRREEALERLGVLALRQPNLGIVFDEATRVLADVLGGGFSAVFELTPVGDELVLRSGTGWPAGFVGSARLPAGPQGLDELTLRAIADPDLLHDHLLVPDPLPPTNRAVSAMGAPLMDGHGPVGAIAAYSSVPRPFCKHEEAFLRSVADVIGAAVHRRRVEDAAAAARDRVTAGSAEQFRRLFAASPDAIVLLDPHDPTVSWPIVDCNEAACRMNGYTRDELIGRSIDILNLSEGTHDERMSYLMRLRRNGVISLETSHRHKDGHVIPVEVSTSLVTLGDRELVLGVDRDITDRMHAQEEARASYQALRRADQERGRLLARLVQAQEEERARVADDIHDDSIQVLTAVGFRLHGLRAKLDPALEPDVLALEETVQHAIFRLRHLLFELRPPELDESGLGAALLAYATRIRDDERLAITLEGELDREPSSESRVLLYRLAQEALTNVRKHAKANGARVCIAHEGEGVLVRVVDDGIGFVPGHAQRDAAGHIGLISMRERAELAGGWFRLESEPGRGTTVSFWIPDSSAGVS